MKRYLGSLANLILTDYIEFRWYVAGEHRITARLAKAGIKGKWIPEPDGTEQVSKLLQGFMITQTPTVNNPKELAIRMASIAQLIRNAISLTCNYSGTRFELPAAAGDELTRPVGA